MTTLKCTHTNRYSLVQNSILRTFFSDLARLWLVSNFPNALGWFPSTSETSSSNVCNSSLNSRRLSTESHRQPDDSCYASMPSSSTPPRKSLLRSNLSSLRRFLVIGSDSVGRKTRSRRQSDYYDNDANSLALSCTAADEETVPLSQEHAERIVCKEHSTVRRAQSTNSVDLEHKADLLKGKCGPFGPYYRLSDV